MYFYWLFSGIVLRADNVAYLNRGISCENKIGYSSAVFIFRTIV